MFNSYQDFLANSNLANCMSAADMSVANTRLEIANNILSDYRSLIIRSSNTIFSTMVCPKCGERLVFDEDMADGFRACCHNDGYEVDITIRALIALLNNNGLNQLVTPPKPYKAPEETKRSEDVPPPDGLKIEPIEEEE